MLSLAEGMLTGRGCTCVTWSGRDCTCVTWRGRALYSRRTGGSYTSSSSGLNGRSLRRRLLALDELSEQRQQKLSARARSKWYPIDLGV